MSQSFVERMVEVWLRYPRLSLQFNFGGDSLRYCALGSSRPQGQAGRGGITVFLVSVVKFDTGESLRVIFTRLRYGTFEFFGYFFRDCAMGP